MDSKKLSARTKQPGHDQTYRASEERFSAVLRRLLSSQRYIIVDKPRDLADLFPKVGSPGETYGIVPEVSVTSTATGKKMYFEVKKQGPRGNADERACKHHTVAFYRTLQGRFGYPYHPFVTIFCESLATDVRYVSKHPFYFERAQYLCWVDYDVDLLRTFLTDLFAGTIDVL